MKKILALLLALVMVMALAACGGGSAPAEETAPEAPVEEAAAPEAPVEEPAAPAEEPAAPVEEPAAPADPAGDASGEMGEASEEPTGEPVAELYDPAGYDKDLEGYKAYVIDALRSDEHAPAEIIEMTVETITAATDGNDSTFDMMIHQGRILSYEDFLAN